MLPAKVFPVGNGVLAFLLILFQKLTSAIHKVRVAPADSENKAKGIGCGNGREPEKGNRNRGRYPHEFAYADGG